MPRRLSLVRAALVAIVLSVWLVAPVAAGPLENAVVAYVRGDFAVAINLLRPLAASGTTGKEHDEAVRYRDDAAAVMTSAQIAEAQKLARQWKPKAE